MTFISEQLCKDIQYRIKLRYLLKVRASLQLVKNLEASFNHHFKQKAAFITSQCNQSQQAFQQACETLKSLISKSASEVKDPHQKSDMETTYQTVFRQGVTFLDKMLLKMRSVKAKLETQIEQLEKEIDSIKSFDILLDKCSEYQDTVDQVRKTLKNAKTKLKEIQKIGRKSVVKVLEILSRCLVAWLVLGLFKPQAENDVELLGFMALKVLKLLRTILLKTFDCDEIPQKKILFRFEF